MQESIKSFENATDDCSNVPETFLEPLRLNLSDLPDYSRLDKPKKPPVPVVRKKPEESQNPPFQSYIQILGSENSFIFKNKHL